MAPLYNLIAFIIIPAHKQIVFLAGADLIVSIFLTTVVRLVAGWAVNTTFAQEFLRNMTESAHEVEIMEARRRTYKNEL